MLPEFVSFFHPAAFQATVAQLLVDAWTFHSLMFNLLPDVLATGLAPFFEVKIDPDHESPKGPGS